MNGPIIIFIIGATVSFSMWLAYLSQKSKERVDIARARGPDDDAPGREEFDQLNQQVAELAERLDFTERLLAQKREPSRIEQPRE